MRVRLFLEVLRYRWKVALLVWIATPTMILFVASLGAWQYTATSVVLVEPKAQGFAPATAVPNATQLATEIEVVRSERVALRAIRSLSLQDHAGWRALWEKRTAGVGSFEAWLSERLLTRLEIGPTRLANVLSISYTSGDPETAATIANAFTQAYLDVAADLRRESAREYSALVAESARQLRAELETTQVRRTGTQQADAGSPRAVPETEGRVASDLVARTRTGNAAPSTNVIAVNSLRDQQLVVNREVESAQSLSDAMLSRFSQTSLEGGGTHRNLSVLKLATHPVLPSWPDTPLLLGAGSVVGLIAAVFAAFLRERTDMRVRTNTDLPKIVGIRLIGLLENIGPDGMRQARIPAG